jgi:hypothetical protein
MIRVIDVVKINIFRSLCHSLSSFDEIKMYLLTPRPNNPIPMIVDNNTIKKFEFGKDSAVSAISINVLNEK